MPELKTIEAKCLCGAVQMTVKSEGNRVLACHCNMCRQWGGGPYMAVGCGTDVTFASEEHVGVFDSSPWADRGFCKRCGTHLFYRIKQNKQYQLPAALVEARGDLSFEMQVFIDEKPDHYAFANETKKLTGAEVFAMFAPKKG